MSAHHWRPAVLFVLAALVAIIGGLGVFQSQSAEAAPARNLQVYEQACTSGGNVRVTFVWNPSGSGTQWFDISRLPNFAAFGNEGPFGPGDYYTRWTLDSNTTYYARVATFSPGLEYSNTLQFQTINCGGGFTPPFGVDVDVFSNFVRVDWHRGNNNLFFCVDTAFTYSDLVNIRGSFHNWGCGTTATQLDLTNLACGRTHFLRIWAAGPGVSGYSEVVEFVSQPCAFSPPSNPRDNVLSSSSVRLAWDRGENNLFFCVDLARSQNDLLNLVGSWFNTHCGTTGTVVDVGGLQCNTDYWWRVWAAGPGTSGYSPVNSFRTAPCPFQPPTDLEAEITGGGDDITFDWDASVPAADWYCVDFADSQSALVNFGSTWGNACVPGSMTQVTVEDLAEMRPDRTLYWRVFAFAGGMAGYSDIETIVIP